MPEDYPRLYTVRQAKGEKGEALLVGVTTSGDVIRSIVYLPIAPGWWGRRICRGKYRTEFIRLALEADPDFIRHL